MLLKSYRMMLLKCCTQYVSKFGKLWLQDQKRSVFIPVPKTGETKECSDFHIIVLMAERSKVLD